MALKWSKIGYIPFIYQAAAPPAAAAAQGDGEASEQALKAQVQLLQQTVAELKASSLQKLQELYVQQVFRNEKRQGRRPLGSRP
jgi:hypothetical protein